jgi:SAM-dependent methyltransferase
VLLWITQLQLYGNRLNILGLTWLLSLTYYTFRQIRKPLNELRAQKGWKPLKTWRLILLSLVPVMLTHFVHDEIDTFLIIGFGHFEPYLGVPLTIGYLWAVKFDVYLAIGALLLMAVLFDLETRFRFSWKTLLFSLTLFSFSAWASWVFIGDFAGFQGWERFWRFWLSYPLSKTLLAMAYIFALKKSPGTSSGVGGELSQTLYQRMLARIINRGRHSLMQKVASFGRFGLNLGCGHTRYQNKLNIDIDRKADLDLLADARFLPFRSGTFKEIFMDQVLEHIPQDLKVVEEVHRVLRQPGWFVCSVPRKGMLARIDKFVLHPHEFHANYTEDRLGDLLSSCGFQILGSWLYGTLPYYFHIWSMPAASLFMIGETHD